MSRRNLKFSWRILVAPLTPIALCLGWYLSGMHLQGENAADEIALRVEVYTPLARTAHRSSYDQNLRPTAFFLEEDDDLLRDLAERLKASGFVLLGRSHSGRRATDQSGRLIDCTTGKPAALLTIEIRQRRRDRAVGVAKYWRDGEWASRFGFKVEKRNGRWIIVNFDRTSVS